ncbi:unnamed protein product, partial [Candidula unifasciata]
SGALTSVPSNSLPPGLSIIILNTNPLTNFSDDAFDTSTGTLRELYITSEHLPAALMKLTSLTDLTITRSKVQNWDTAILKHIAATVESFELSSMSLSSWPSWLSYFHLLRKLDLNNNPIHTIPDDAFSAVNNSLTDLRLSRTGLTGVPTALSTLSSLSSLDLSYNNLKDVSEIQKITGFPFSQHLSYLSLDSVGLTRMANLSNLTSLKGIYLSDNMITDIPAGLLPISITSLRLYNNSLSSVPTVIANLSMLSELELTNNVITHIEPNSFPSSMTRLELGRNKLTIITNSTFRNLNLLSYLDVSYNPISTISPEAFSDLESLEQIYIIYSQLIEIPLAFAMLNYQIDVYFSTTRPLACPCPVSHKLVLWFTSLENSQNIQAICSNGQSIDSYLGGHCYHSLTDP